MVMVYDLDQRNGIAWVAVAAAPDRRGQGIALLGLGHVVTELFRNWRIRRVCLEVLEPNLARFERVDRYATEYGRLRRDRLVGDRHVDLVLFGIDREVWRREAEDRLLRRRFPRPDPPVSATPAPVGAQGERETDPGGDRRRRRWSRRTAVPLVGVDRIGG
jgi:hypothetical protein